MGILEKIREDDHEQPQGQGHRQKDTKPCGAAFRDLHALHMYASCFVIGLERNTNLLIVDTTANKYERGRQRRQAPTNLMELLLEPAGRLFLL